ncbi:VanZ family protein [Paenibacillus sp. Y412MC10]|uniref:VanZ family protein n=1 Tax=Geobacillus sp. (strain Y412MC10) TaxID=481743 RepID=UPI0011A2EF66|nr:VanZ family protein [Paenibacillus sp. Y412MC10]
MKLTPKWMVLLLYALYLYVLVKIILFKFGDVNISFLWQQLQRSIDNPEHMQNRLQFANLTPFKSIHQNMKRLSSPHDVINLFGNIAIFIPNGIFVSVLLKNKWMGWLGAFVTSFGLSLGLECSQILFSMGSFDVDDLILNTAGGVIGCSMVLVLKLTLSEKQSHIDEGRGGKGKPLSEAKKQEASS